MPMLPSLVLLSSYFTMNIYLIKPYCIPKTWTICQLKCYDKANIIKIVIVLIKFIFKLLKVLLNIHYSLNSFFKCTWKLELTQEVYPMSLICESSWPQIINYNLFNIYSTGSQGHASDKGHRSDRLSWKDGKRFMIFSNNTHSLLSNRYPEWRYHLALQWEVDCFRGQFNCLLWLSWKN